MRKFYTEEEDKFILNNYRELGSKFCAEKLGRTRPSIVQRAKKLGVTTNIRGRGAPEWLGKEIDYIKENYPSQGATKCAEHLGRSYNSVKLKANSLGLTRDNYWTDDEDSIIKEYYPTKGKHGTKAFLPGRSIDSIVTRASSLGIKVERSGYTHKEYEDLLFEREIDFYPLENYRGSDTPILHECLKEHQWKVRPKHILSGSGCPKCSKYGLKLDEPAFLYYVSFRYKDYIYYKIGVTKLDINSRFSKDSDKIIKTILLVHFSTGQEALDVEQELLHRFKEHKLNLPNILKSGGSTEVLKSDLTKEINDTLSSMGLYSSII